MYGSTETTFLQLVVGSFQRILSFFVVVVSCWWHSKSFKVFVVSCCWLLSLKTLRF